MHTADTRQPAQAYIAVGIAEGGEAPRATHVVMLTQEQFEQQRIHMIAFDGILKTENEALWSERAALHLQAEKFLDEGRGLTYGTAMLMRLGAPVAADLNVRLSDALTVALKAVSDETVRLNARWGKGINCYHAEILFEQAVTSIEADLGLASPVEGLGHMFAKKSPAYAARYLAFGYICQAIRHMYEGDHAHRRLAA